MALDMFLKISGIKGESLHSTHKNEIDILGFNFSASYSGSFSYGSEAGNSSITDLCVQKYVDASSTELLKHCLTGKHIEEVKIIVRRGGYTPLEYTVITLTKAIVTCVNPTGYKSGDQLTETVCFSFAEIKMEYDTQNEKGEIGDHYTVAYNFSTKEVG